ncbi:MAG: transcription antitermination factor NusB [Candidatus Bipolaricaulota bacterium]|jgi:N utilization substance protein B|nr:transcription antitermination factor NusB [Candidatus Bipolaricaulota bacterium]
MHRREAREFLLSVLYQREFLQAPLDELLEEVDPGDQRGYIERVLSGIGEHGAQIDDLIAERTVGWRFERLALIDRNILRLGTFELLYLPDVPPEAAIDEAVELCKKYGTENARVFVNGILDRIWKENVSREGTGREADRPPAAGGAGPESGCPEGKEDLPEACRDSGER